VLISSKVADGSNRPNTLYFRLEMIRGELHSGCATRSNNIPMHYSITEPRASFDSREIHSTLQLDIVDNITCTSSRYCLVLL
jgi:hypothetical protein